MFNLIFWLLVIAVVAALLGFGGVAAFAAHSALFLIAAVVLAIILGGVWLLNAFKPGTPPVK